MSSDKFKAVSQVELHARTGWFNRVSIRDVHSWANMNGAQLIGLKAPVTSSRWMRCAPLWDAGAGRGGGYNPRVIRLTFSDPTLTVAFKMRFG